MNMRRTLKCLCILLPMGYALARCQQVASPSTIGEVLCNIKLTSFRGIYKLIYVGSYISGFAVISTAIFKLKQVKDNPTQIPVSTPIVLFVCGTLLMILPSIIAPAGETLFGSGTAASAYSINSSGQITDNTATNPSVIPDNLLDGGP